MFNKIKDFFNKMFKKEKRITEEEAENSRAAAKDRLHIVLMQDRANISADFLDLMREEIVEVIKKYIVVNEKEIDVRLTHSVQEDGTPNPPSLYANIPIVNIRNDMKARTEAEKREEEKTEKKEIEKAKKTIKNEEKELEKKNKDKDKNNEINIDEDEKINIIIDKAEEIKEEAEQEEKRQVEKLDKNKENKENKENNKNNKTEDKEKKK